MSHVLRALDRAVAERLIAKTEQIYSVVDGPAGSGRDLNAEVEDAVREELGKDLPDEACGLPRGRAARAHRRTGEHPGAGRRPELPQHRDGSTLTVLGVSGPRWRRVPSRRRRRRLGRAGRRQPQPDRDRDPPRLPTSTRSSARCAAGTRSWPPRPTGSPTLPTRTAAAPGDGERPRGRSHRRGEPATDHQDPGKERVNGDPQRRSVQLLDYQWPARRAGRHDPRRHQAARHGRCPPGVP